MSLQKGGEDVLIKDYEVHELKKIMMCTDKSCIINTTIIKKKRQFLFVFFNRCGHSQTSLHRILSSLIFADEAHNVMKSSSAMQFLGVYANRASKSPGLCVVKNKGPASVALITGFSRGTSFKTKISKGPCKPSEET